MAKTDIKQLIEHETRLINLLNEKKELANLSNQDQAQIENLLVDIIKSLKHNNTELPIPYVDFYTASTELAVHLKKLRKVIATDLNHYGKLGDQLNQLNDQLSVLIFSHPTLLESGLSRPLVLADLPTPNHTDPEQVQALIETLQQQFDELYPQCEQITDVAEQKMAAASKTLDRMQRSKFAEDKQKEQEKNVPEAIETMTIISIYHLASLLANDSLHALNQMIARLQLK